MLLRTTISRRSWLSGLGAGAAAMVGPFLRREARADAGKPGPLRLLVIQTSDGRPSGLWHPQGSETDFNMGRTMEAFEKVKSDLVVLTGLYHQVDSGQENHCGGLIQWMTGRGGVGGNNYTAAQAPSIDQIIAKNAAFVGNTRFKSLQLAGDNSAVATDISHRYLSWAGADQPLPGEHRPLESYKQVFGALAASSTSPAAVEQLIRNRKSVLDLLKRDWQRMSAVVPAAQKPSFDAHLDSLRGLEADLSRLTAATPACPLPDTAAFPATGVETDTAFPSFYKANMEIIRLAFACDLTRVVTFMSSPTTSTLDHKPWAPGMQTHDGHHASTHAAGGLPSIGNPDTNVDAGMENVIAINSWYSARIADAVARLKTTSDVGGASLLDNMIVFYGSELGDGRGHSYGDVPFVLFGRAGGRLKTGRYLRMSRNSNDLWLSVLDLLGMPVDTIGDASKCTGPLPGLP